MYYQGKVLVHAQQHSVRVVWTIDNSDNRYEYRIKIARFPAALCMYNDSG